MMNYSFRSKSRLSYVHQNAVVFKWITVVDIFCCNVIMYYLYIYFITFYFQISQAKVGIATKRSFNLTMMGRLKTSLLVEVIVFLCLGQCGYASQGLSCSVTELNVFIGPVVRPVDAVENRLSAGRSVHQHDVHKDELGALVYKEREIDQNSLHMKIKPRRRGQQNKNYPAEGYFDINVQQSALLICYNATTMKDYEKMEAKLKEYFGSDNQVTPMGAAFRTKASKEKSLVGLLVHGYNATMETDGFKFALKWNVTDFNMTPLDLTKITEPSKISSLPFYLSILGGMELNKLDTTFVYIREKFKYKEGSAEENVKIWYNDTRWHFSLHAPFVSDNLDYRISLIGSHGERCVKSMDDKTKILNIYCHNDVEKDIFMNKNLQLLFYTFHNYVPNYLFRILLGYSDVFLHAPTAQKVLIWMGDNVTNLLLTYAVVILLCQLLPFKNLDSKLLRSNAAIVSLGAYLVLFCPSILLVIDVQETVALVYMFYLNTVAWDFGVYWLLCISWILYPGLMCVLGLLPATFFLSDIKINGHFHSFLRRSKCPETCPLSCVTDPIDVEENDDESEIIIEKSQEKIPLEDKPYEMPKFTKIQKIPLESEKSVMIVDIPSSPQEKKIRDTQNIQNLRKITNGSRVNLKAIMCDILGLVHGTLYLFSIQCFYFIVTGLYPMFNFIVVAVAIAAFEIYLTL